MNEDASIEAIHDLNKALSDQNVADFQGLLIRLASSEVGIKALAARTGISRETLWRYRSGETEAQLKSIMDILRAAGCGCP